MLSPSVPVLISLSATIYLTIIYVLLAWAQRTRKLPRA